MKTVLFYVSGHGYGHIVRMSEVMRELRRLQPDWRILARTQAPEQMLPDGVGYTAAEFDSGVVEREAGVVVDEDATIARLRGLLARWDTIVDDELRFVTKNHVDLLIADVPPMAGDIAHGADIPCFAISNFTWDWIYEPYAGQEVARLRDAYSRMDALLRLPFAQSEGMDMFRRVVDAPLIARRSDDAFPVTRPPVARVRALMGSRAQVSEAAFRRAMAESPDFEFVIPTVGPGFPQTLASCDLVIAKLGFSMVAESIAARKPLLYPPRVHFREEMILQGTVRDHIPALAIPLRDFYSGNWAPYLRELVGMPQVESSLTTNGAEFCAGFIADALSG